MIYLDNAATTMPKPPGVIKAVTEALTACGNPARGAHGASVNSLRCTLEARQAVAEMFNAGNPMRVAFTPNATAALNIAIGGIKGHVVTTAAEHNSVLRPLYRRGNFSVVPLDAFGRLDLKLLEAGIKTDTEAIVMTHASNLTGNVYDILGAGEICRRRGIKFIVDAAQTAGLLPIDMSASNIDALCLSGHKSLYGPQGIGAICLSEQYLPAPLIVGGSGGDSFASLPPAEMPGALEAGTQNMPGIAGLLAGIRYVNNMGGHVFLSADILAREFISGVITNTRVTLYGDASAPVRIPVVAFNIRDIDSAVVASRLYEEYGIAARAGAHCAPLMHGTFKLKGAVRLSFSHFNTQSEVKTAIKAIEEISKSTGG